MDRVQVIVNTVHYVFFNILLLTLFLLGSFETWQEQTAQYLENLFQIMPGLED